MVGLRLAAAHNESGMNSSGTGPYGIDRTIQMAKQLFRIIELVVLSSLVARHFFHKKLVASTSRKKRTNSRGKNSTRRKIK